MKKTLLLLFTFINLQTFSQINLVKDLYEGSNKSGNPTLYGVYKDKLYFGSRTTESAFSEKSFTYDGTAVKSITDNNNTPVTISIIYMPENGADDAMIITKREGSNIKTFTYNGTSFNKISDERAFGGGIKFNGKYYFTGQFNNKYPIFFTDGTESGTGFLNEDANTFLSFQLTERAVVNNNLLFGADTDENGFELWKTDGTESGTSLVKDIYEGDSNSSPKNFFTTADKSLLYFTAEAPDEGRELWVTNGTESGTIMLKDFNTGTKGDEVKSITEMNGKVYFVMNNKLWVTDGTSENTTEIAESDERYLIVLNNNLYFHKDKSMYKTDGTVAGTEKVTPDDIGIEWRSFPVLFNNEIYFSGGEFDRNGNIDTNELWKTDGTTNGTVLVKVIDTEFIVPPSQFIKVGNELVFRGVQKSTGQELWKTDGTESGTMIIEDKVSGNGSLIIDLQSSRTNAVLNNRLLLNVDAKDGLGKELYEYNNDATASVLDNNLKSISLFYNDKFIHIKGIEKEKATLKVYDVLGKTIHKTNFKSKEKIYIDFKSGLYFAHLRTESGKTLKKKILIQ